MALELPKFGKKEKTEGASSPKNDIMLKIMDFFDKNPIMKILIPVVLFLILAGIVLFLVFGDKVLTDDNSDTTDINANTNQVEILPGDDIIKDKEVVELIDSDPLSEDVLASAKYKGYVTGNSGLKTALIQIGSSAEPECLSRGDKIGDWELVEINSSYVIFKAGDVTKKISM